MAQVYLSSLLENLGSAPGPAFPNTQPQLPGIPQTPPPPPPAPALLPMQLFSRCLEA